MKLGKLKPFLIETDVLVAAMDPEDPHHSEAIDVIVVADNCFLSPYALMELDLLIRSGNIKVRNLQLFWRKLLDTLNHYSIYVAMPSPLHYAEAAKLRTLYELTYFDSLHAATAIIEGKPLVSFDERAYSNVRNLRYVHPSRLRTEARG